LTSAGHDFTIRTEITSQPVTGVRKLATVENLEISECERCRRGMAQGALYMLRSGRGGDVVRCIRCSLMHWPTLSRSLKIAAIVGTVLVAINQGDVVFSGEVPTVLLWKAPLTFATPFIVSLWGAMGNARVGR
jgi:hypothetical protein